ncbi:MAG: hypothetical protein WEG56_04520, partial [Chloroflexota bacterium]
VGLGVGAAVAFGVGLGVGAAVAFGVAVGAAVGFGVGFGVAVGFGVGGTVTVMVPPVSESSNRSRLIALNITAWLPAARLPAHVKRTSRFQSVPPDFVIAKVDPPIVTRT